MFLEHILRHKEQNQERKPKLKVQPVLQSIQERQNVGSFQIFKSNYCQTAQQKPLERQGGHFQQTRTIRIHQIQREQSGEAVLQRAVHQIQYDRRHRRIL